MPAGQDRQDRQGRPGAPGEPGGPGEPGEQVLDILRAPAGARAPREPSGPRIRLLGEVELLGARGPVSADQRPRLTEIAAYVALNPGSDQRALELLIDPAPRRRGQSGSARGPAAGRGLAVAVDRLRDWLGDDPSGRPYLPLDSSRGYAFGPAVSCDWDEFRALHRRGVRGTPGGDRALARALALVSGAPCAVADPTGYAWAEPFRQDMISAIVDTAHELAVRRLRIGDHRGAEAAAYRGLTVEPGTELLHRDLLTIYAAAGARDQLLKAVSRLHAQATRDGHPLEPDTTALLRDLLEA
jgi:hypothetical protein